MPAKSGRLIAPIPDSKTSTFVTSLIAAATAPTAANKKDRHRWLLSGFHPFKSEDHTIAPLTIRG